jgi:hypothetical protein
MLGVSLFLSIGTHQVCAADDDDTVSTNHLGRPIGELFKTEVVYPQEKGELEAEVTSVYQRRSGGDIWSVPISLEYGLTDQWQVEAEWNSFMQHHLKHGSFDRGIGDVEIGSQYSFMNVGDSLFHVAPRFSVGIPVGDVNKDFSEGFIEYEPAVVFARDIPELHYTQVFTEIGLGLVQRAKHSGDADDAEPAAHEFNLGAGFFTLFPHGAFTFEFNWTNNQWNNHGTENQLYVTPGILVRATKNIEIGLGIPVGLNQQSDRFDIAAHITCEF